MLQVGDTFLLPGKKDPDGIAHLWLIITVPDSQTGNAVCVNITSRKASFCDTTVILKPGDHSYIVRESVVSYRHAAMMNLFELDKALTGGYQIVCTQKDPCSTVILKRVQEGMLESKFVANELKEYCRKMWGR